MITLQNSKHDAAIIEPSIRKNTLFVHIEHEKPGSQQYCVTTTADIDKVTKVLYNQGFGESDMISEVIMLCLSHVNMAA